MLSAPRREAVVAYVLWLPWLFGVGGLHRFYLGKHLSGFIYLFTWGLFGLGQVIDLLTIPGMTDSYNRKFGSSGIVNTNQVTVNIGEEIRQQLGAVAAAPAPAMPAIDKTPMQQLLQLAEDNNGILSSSKMALHLNMPPEKLKSLVNEALSLGYAEVTNDSNTGAVRYKFDV